MGVPRGARFALAAALGANLVTLVVNLFSILVLPAFVSIPAFANWQLYLVLVSLTGLAHLGLLDGLYLILGGQRLDQEDHGALAAQFWLMAAVETVAFGCVAAFVAVGVPDGQRAFVLVTAAANLVVANAWTYLQFVLQATGEVVDYAWNLIGQKLLFLVAAAALLALGHRDAEWIIGADLVTKVAAVIGLVMLHPTLAGRTAESLPATWRAALGFVAVGLPLLVANASSILVLAIYRLAIENRWGLETFGKVSLVISAANMVISLIAAVGVVLFPMLRRVDVARARELYGHLRSLLMGLSLASLLLYQPAVAVLRTWLPAYAASLGYLVWLMPMCVFELKMTVLVATYLKAFRKERGLLVANLAAIAITVPVVAATVYGLGDLTACIASILVVLCLRVLFAEWILSRHLDVQILTDQLIEAALVAAFVASTLLLPGWAAALCYAPLLAGYLYAKRSSIGAALAVVRG